MFVNFLLSVLFFIFSVYYIVRRILFGNSGSLAPPAVEILQHQRLFSISVSHMLTWEAVGGKKSLKS